jgi:hypothetical protein
LPGSAQVGFDELGEALDAGLARCLRAR